MTEYTLPSTPTGRKSYKSLKHLIKMQVKEGELVAHERLPGMRSICDTYEISLATVQRALSELCEESVLYSQKGRGTFVAPVRRECKHIGILCGMGISGLQDSMFGPLMQIIQKNALEDDKNVTLFQAKKKNIGQHIHFDIQDIIRHEVDVLILVNVVNLGLIASLKQLGIPIIATDLDATDIGVHSVYFDNEVSSFEMTRNLINDGHKNLWFVGGLEQSNPRYDLCRRQRFTGFRLGCRAGGVEQGLDFFSKKYGVDQSLRESLEEAITKHAAPTAIVTEDGRSIAQICREMGLSVEIACWAGDAHYQDVLSQVRYLAPVDFALMGEKSYELLKRIDSGVDEFMMHTVIQSEILSNSK